jgi:sugar phosphate isomerase/epimerase
MKLASKVEPRSDRLKEAYQKGFEHTELYLTTEMLDKRDDIVDVCKRSRINIASVHTPHCKAEQNPLPYYRKSDRLAKELDATLVIDSAPIGMSMMRDMVLPPSEISAQSYGYENNPSDSEHYIRVNHLGKGHRLILDTAHINMTEKEYLPFIEECLSIYSAEEIPVIHLADGTLNDDGVPLGDGTVDVPAIVNLIDKYDYGGTVVLEVMQEHQEPAREIVESLR